jgi:hypothetical protein
VLDTAQIGPEAKGELPRVVAPRVASAAPLIRGSSSRGPSPREPGPAYALATTSRTSAYL